MNTANSISSYIDKYEQGQLYGWVFDRKHPDKVLTINVYCKQHLIGKGTANIQRDDLKMAGLGNGEHGFAIELDVSSLSIDKPNQIILTLEDTQPIRSNKYTIELVDRKNSKQHVLRFNIEKLDQFYIHGWAVKGTTAPNSISVKIAGYNALCSVIWCDRKDVAQTLNIENQKVGFEIELAGNIWDMVPDDEAAEIYLYADNQALNKEALKLSRQAVISWISNITSITNNYEQQYFSFLALEHLFFGKLCSELEKLTLSYLNNFANKFNLTGLVDPDIEIPIFKEKPHCESANTLLLWRAMRTLNHKLINEPPSAGVFDSVTEVLSELCLEGEVRDWYLFLAVQLCCESGEFHKLRSILDFFRIRSLADSNLAEHMTLALPALIADGYMSAALKLFKKLRFYLTNGWLHTSCIRYSIEQIIQLEGQGKIGIKEANQFRYLYFDFLDEFKGQWFSRIHDRELVVTLVSIISAMNHYSDQMRNDLIATAIKHYGVSPIFWKLINELPELMGSKKLFCAQKSWLDVSMVIENWNGQLSSQQLANFIASVRYFLQRGNTDVLIVMREVLANSLTANKNYDYLVEQLIKILVGSDACELLRIKALPFEFDHLLVQPIPEMDEKICALLRELETPKPEQLQYQLQHYAASILLRFSEFHDRESCIKYLMELESLAVLFSNWQVKDLECDWLASCYVFALQEQLETETLLKLLRKSLLKAINDNLENYVAAPVYTAINRLREQTSDKFTVELVTETEQIIRHKYSDPRLISLMPPINPDFCSNRINKGDEILVVIMISKNRLFALNKIRESWLKNIVARKIPYLFVISEGNDEIEQDVLHLKGVENAIETPLVLFEWVFKHSNAQYVVYITDDCYFNADEYFDSLSYRKHHYYGKRVKKNQGSLDRMIRQPGDADLRIDKSPEPSVYADGNHVYSLSRLAIIKLLTIKQTKIGQRLVLTSCHQDKLIGDLLARANIRLSNQDYYLYEKQMLAKEKLVSFETKLPTVIDYANAEDNLFATKKQLKFREFWDKKIWPSYFIPSAQNNDNALKLLTALKHTERILNAQIVVIAVVRNELLMLPHFLAHYRKLGVQCFIFADNCSDDGTKKYLYKQPDVILFSADTEYKQSHYGVAWQQAILANYCLGKWVLLADADEFLVYEDCENINIIQFVATIESENDDAVFVHMIDMYPYNDLDSASFENTPPFDAAPYFDKNAQLELKFGGGQFSNSKNYVNGLRHRIAPSRINAYVSQKYPLFKYKSWMRMTEGIHYSTNMQVSKVMAFFAHFKYHSGFKEKVYLEVKRKQHYNEAEEYLRYANMFEEDAGGFGDEDLTVKYINSMSFVDNFK